MASAIKARLDEAQATAHNQRRRDAEHGEAMMSDVLEFTPGGYRFVPSVFQYSAGVAALPGYHIVRETFAEPVPVARGFEMIEARLKSGGLPTTRFCACELRSPENGRPL